ITPRAEAGRLTFAELLEAHATRYLGGTATLPAVAGAEAPTPSVYVTLSSGRIMVWDHEIAALSGAGVPAKTDLATWPPVCLPRLRDAVASALASETERLRHDGDKSAARVILLADPRLPYVTFLAVAYSIAHASTGAPPELRLAARTGGAEPKI